MCFVREKLCIVSLCNRSSDSLLWWSLQKSEKASRDWGWGLVVVPDDDGDEEGDELGSPLTAGGGAEGGADGGGTSQSDTRLDVEDDAPLTPPPPSQPPRRSNMFLDKPKMTDKNVKVRKRT